LQAVNTRRADEKRHIGEEVNRLEMSVQGVQMQIHKSEQETLHWASFGELLQKVDGQVLQRSGRGHLAPGEAEH
jgi:hypothetical protein